MATGTGGGPSGGVRAATPAGAPSGDERGFTLVESLVAMMIVAMVVISYIGIRTSALLDATHARNWRLAREIAEERMSELMAGARETPAESGQTLQLEKYPGFAVKIVIGEAAVADLEAEVASEAAGDDLVANERIEWQRDRDSFRRASARGLSAADFQQQRAEDVNVRLAEKAPSATEYEEVAVAVYFPRLEARFPDDRDALVIKARLSTLALSGMTPQQAQALATARGQTSGEAAAGAAGGTLPATGGR